MYRSIIVLLLSCMPLLAFGAAAGDTVALSVMERLFNNGERSAMEIIKAELYLKQRVKVGKKNLLVNLFPNMTRFDRDEKSYLSEYVYKVEHIYRTLPEIRLVSSLSTFSRGNGEMEAVLEFMTPQLSGERLFNSEYLSPLSAANRNYYRYSIDTLYCQPGKIKVLALPRFDNIQLLSRASFVVNSTDCKLVEVSMQGWNEQCCFDAAFDMNKNCDFVVDSVQIDIDYSFWGNRMKIYAQGVYTYEMLRPYEGGTLRRHYDMGADAGMLSVGDALQSSSVEQCRKIPLSGTDSLFYRSKNVPRAVKEKTVNDSSGDAESIKKLLWRVGDEAISSHTLVWGDSDLKLMPLINPSYLSYSSNRGLSYKLAVNLRTSFSSRCKLTVKPVLGYNFKYKEAYWNVRSVFSFAPMKRAAFTADVGRGQSGYSSEVIDYIKNSSLDSLHFDRLPIVYYRDFHVKADVRFEPFNGLELLLGANFYRRSLYNSVMPEGVQGMHLERYYRRFAPHLRLAWHPGMYYYVSGGKKINLGSRAPRFVLDVEQGMSGVFASSGRYTRMEFDVQYKRTVSSVSSLYLRAAAGGYFFADDIFFVDYTFLKNSLLPIDKDDETSGEFQLLDREWYNSADRYLAFNTSYESPFLFFQRIIPQARFIKNEALYVNVLFISHLCPYWECGYGVDTPYVNIGLFAGFEMGSFHRIGYKLTFSLFKE